ncbi:MAG TPA: response regulator transcription factor [Clostridia bacterium]|nr:response regulator transcription factor [Clostridia bacterium]
MKMRVVIVDDHKIVLQGLKLYLRGQPDVEVVGEAANDEDALRCIAQTRPNLVFLDMDLAGVNGVLLARQIFQQYPETKIIIYSGYITPQYVQEAVQAGVSGYLNKTHDVGEIEAALQAVKNGQVYLCTEAATLIARDYRKKSNSEASRLSDREKEILKRIAEGQSTKEIAGDLSVSVKTIETHRQNIMEKLNLHSVAELTKYAIRQGLTRV